jgi:hypothetical protein
MKISYEKLRRAFYYDIQDPELAIGKPYKKMTFKKIH